MTRLAAALRCDLRLQLRGGFVAAGVVVTLFFVAVLWQVPGEALAPWVPAFVFFNLLVTTFYFVAGLVLFEKGEGVLEALVVTPLREGEYLASKVLTLALLALVETAAIVALCGAAPRWAPLLLGGLVCAALYTLAGFLTVARHDQINEFLLPSTLVVIALQLPILDRLGIFESAVFWLWPTQAVLVLLEGGFRELSAVEWAYGLGYGGLATAALFALARRHFLRFIVRREGVR